MISVEAGMTDFDRKTSKINWLFTKHFLDLEPSRVLLTKIVYMLPNVKLKNPWSF